MKKQNLTFRYSLIQASYWMCFAPIMAYVSVYLLDCGFSSTVIGALIAVAGILSSLLQPMVTAYADRPDSISLKWLNILLGGITLACAAALLLFRSSALISLIFYGAAIALLQVSTPLVNALGMNSINCGTDLNYGIAKAAGSLGYAAMAAILGRLTAKLGSQLVPLTIAACYLLFLLSLCLFPRQRAVVAIPTEKQGSSTGFFRKYPRFTLVLLGCVCVFISHMLLNSFTLQIIQTKGGGSQEMGTAIALAAMSELPTTIAFSYLMRKAGSHFWFRLSGIFFTLKILCTLLVSSIPGFYAVQFLQMFAWALISVSSVYYINSIMAPEDAIKGQGYYTMTYTVGSVIGAVVGGRIIDALGAPAMLIFGTISAAIGAALILVFTDKT